jgi:hypothetical protein
MSPSTAAPPARRPTTCRTASTMSLSPIHPVKPSSEKASAPSPSPTVRAPSAPHRSVTSSSRRPI